MNPLATVLLLGFVSISGLAQPAPDENLIRGIRSASNLAIAAGDATAFAASLDKDFVVVTGNGSLLSARLTSPRLQRTLKIRTRYDSNAPSIQLRSRPPSRWPPSTVIG